MTLEEAQKEVDKWIKTYGVRYFSELTNMAVLTEEVGELARVMARKYGDQSFKAGEKDNLDEEIADILWVLLCIANQTGVDVTKAFRKSLEKKTFLKWSILIWQKIQEKIFCAVFLLQWNGNRENRWKKHLSVRHWNCMMKHLKIIKIR